MGAPGMGLVVREENYSIAERNEEINRRMMERRNRGPGGPAKITDMKAYKAFLNKANEEAKKRVELETAEEMERMRREGANYKPRAQREAEAKARRDRYKTAAGEDEARWCNPLKDYYKILEVDKTASLAEIKKSYKRMAIMYHPAAGAARQDKQRNATEEQLEALKDKFKDVMEAYDVLSDEERRCSWERLRENMKNGGGGQAAVRTMTPEEAAAYMHGLRELAMIKRQGYKRTKKHSPIEVEVKVSMRKMYRGHNKTVEIQRTECDSTGGLLTKTKTFHLMIRKGAYDSMKIIFEDEGDETTEYLPGDVIFVLRQKQQKEFKRVGPKDLEHVGPPIERGCVLFAHSVVSLAGTNIIMFGNALARSLESGGMGGFIEERYEIEGCQDPEDPWDNDPGDLTIKIYNTGVRWEERVIRCRIGPHPCYLVGLGGGVAGAVAGHKVAAAVAHRLEAADMEEDEYLCYTGATVAPARPAPSAICFCLSPDGQPTTAARAAMATAAATLPQMRWRCIALATELDLDHLPANGAGAGEILMDAEWCALNEASVVILDMDAADASAAAPTGAVESRTPRERAVVAAGAALARTGLRALLYSKWMQGTQVVAIGDAVALLGNQPADLAGEAAVDWAATALVPLIMRAGGGAAGWGELQGAVGAWPEAPDTVKGVGVMAGALLCVNPQVWWDPDGSVEMQIAPPQEELIATAAAANEGRCAPAMRWEDFWDEVEGDDALAADEGFNERCTKGLVNDAM